MKYIYPPRPETKIAPASLKMFEDMNKFLAEPKLNGSSLEIYFPELKTWNRHKTPLFCKIEKDELMNLQKGKGDMILCGEYMNKNCKDELNQYWNIKYVIWDIIMFEGQHLLGSTFEERYALLTELYPNNPVKKHLHQISDNCFRVNAIDSNFLENYQDLTKWDMYEGLVLKRKDGKLENGTTENNNTKTQIKCRKGTKNYNF